MTLLASLCAAAAAWLLVPRGPHVPRTSDRPSVLTAAQRAGARDAVLTVAVYAALGWAAALLALALLRLVLPRLRGDEKPDDSLSVDDVLIASDFLAVCAGAGLTALESMRRLHAANAGAASVWAGVVLARHATGIPFAAALAACGHASAVDMCRVLVRAHSTGAPVAERLRRQSTALRRERRDETLRRVRALSVRAVAPLGACFLPAFVLLAVVPLAASFAAGMSV